MKAPRKGRMLFPQYQYTDLACHLGFGHSDPEKKRFDKRRAAHGLLGPT